MRKTILLSVFVFLFLVPVALSLNVYIRPPRMVARMNVTPGEVSTYDGFLEIKNENNISVNVTLKPKGVLSDKVELSEEFVALEPGELRTIDFTLSLDQPGTYQDVVLVTYKAGDLPGVALQAEIIAIGNEVEGKEVKNQIDISKYGIIGFIFLVIIILVLILLKRRGA